MTHRTTLKRALFSAWEETIFEDYRAQHINSEAGLQAGLISRLRLPTATHRLFVQPRLIVEIDGKPTVYIPDIIICNSREVIGVIELKYQPRALPQYKHDVSKFAELARLRGNNKLYIKNDRYLGPEQHDTKYWFAKDVLFVWAGVHRKPKTSYQSPDAKPLYDEHGPELRDAFLALHAETSEQEQASAFSKPELQM